MSIDNLIEIKQGDILFHEGDDADKMYVISKGSLMLTKRNGDHDVEIAQLSDGDFMGEIALLTQSPRSCTATALSDSSLIIYSEKRFLQLIEENPGVARRVIQGMATRLKQTTIRLMEKG